LEVSKKVTTNGVSKELKISVKQNGFGSSINGGNYNFTPWLLASVTALTKRQAKEILPIQKLRC